MQIIFQIGLTLRHGERVFELVRQLDADLYQFEDVLTRRAFAEDRFSVLDKIWKKTYQVIIGDIWKSGGNSTEGMHLPSVPLDLSTLDAKAIKEIDRRKAYIDGVNKAHVSRGQRERIAGIIKTVANRIGDPKCPSDSSVMQWMRVYRQEDGNILALLNGNQFRRRNKRKVPMVEELIQEGIRADYLNKNQYSIQHALDRIRSKMKALVHAGTLNPEDATVSFSTLARRVNEVDVDVRLAARYGKNKARANSRTPMNGERPLYPLARVEVDHTLLNWVVVCDRTGLPLGRPLLTACIDSFSNYIHGIYLSFYGPGVTSISGVLRNAIMPKMDFTAGVTLTHKWVAEGIPDMLVLDNGLEFHANSFKLMSWQIGMNLMHCRVRTPWLKPHIEGFFGKLDFLTLSKGRVRKSMPNVQRIDPKRDATILFSDLIKGLIMYCVDVHPFQINTRKMARPIDLFEEGLEMCPPVKYPGDMNSFRLASALNKEMVLSQGGIGLLGVPYGTAELLPMRKRHGGCFKVSVKWDPDDINVIWIQHPATKVWVESHSRWPDYTEGLSWNQHRLIRNFARTELKLKGAYEDLQAARERLHEHWMDATSRKSTADMKMAARFSGVTSARIMSGSSDTEKRGNAVPIADVEIEAPKVREIPSFESFIMG